MSDGPVRKAFRDAGVELQIDDSDLSRIAVCDVAEDDPRWERVQPLVKKYQLVDIAFTRFTDSELDHAKYLSMVPSWHHGYPQPEDHFGYRQITYDLTEHCDHCGIGARQTAPFRMKKAPNWGHRSILQMNWVFDEFFVQPDVWKAVFRPLGIGCRPVLLHRTGQELDSVVQLDIPKSVSLVMDATSHRFATCMFCDRRKYKYITGFFPSPQPTDLQLFRSVQYFGSGAGADRAVLLTGALYRRIKEASLKGAEFHACK